MTRKEYDDAIEEIEFWTEKALKTISLNRRSSEEEKLSIEYCFKKIESDRLDARCNFVLRYCTNDDFQRLLRLERMFENIQKIEKLLEEKEEVIRDMEYEYERDAIVLKD